LFFNDSFLYGDLTLEENLKFYCALYGKPLDEAGLEDLLARFRLKDKRDDLVKTLSSGLEKRAAIVRALLTSPHTLILDEPFNGLDARSRDEVEKVIAAFNRSGGTVILTSHDAGLSLKLAKTVGILDSGTMKFAGSVEQGKDFIISNYGK
jgi:ABC-2 type transport system ATP-binding protein